MKPFSPEDCRKNKATVIPEWVINAFNELLTKRYTGTHEITIKQSEIVNQYLGQEEQPFDYAWLNVEEMYREAGWEVEYDKPGYCESYEAYFTFRRA